MLNVLALFVRNRVLSPNELSISLPETHHYSSVVSDWTANGYIVKSGDDLHLTTHGQTTFQKALAVALPMTVYNSKPGIIPVVIDCAELTGTADGKECKFLIPLGACVTASIDGAFRPTRGHILSLSHSLYLGNQQEFRITSIARKVKECYAVLGMSEGTVKSDAGFTLGIYS